MSNRIRLWRIVPQIVNVRGTEVQVDCKQIRFFPKYNAQGGLEGFGMLKSCPWQVCVQRANWPDGQIWKIRWNPGTGKWAVIYNEQMDPIDPHDRRWTPEKTARKVINQDNNLTSDGIERILRDRIKDGSGQPDEELIDNICNILIFSAEGSEAPARVA